MIKNTRLIMGMPITLMAHDGSMTDQQIEALFALFYEADEKYSPYKSTSEVSQLNAIPALQRRYSSELAHIMQKAEDVKRATHGYFDVEHDGHFDPSGIVKGWMLQKAAEYLKRLTPNFYIEAGGDIQVGGVSESGKPWQIGVRNPFNRQENVAIVSLDKHAIATSGTAIRGDHIYNPVDEEVPKDVASLTVLAKHIVNADAMATAAFAMGKKGITFLEKLPGY